MPAWESVDGVGQFLSLPMSMTNGSLANGSEMKLGAHSGTRVDAPGHVFQHYFETGLDVDRTEDKLKALKEQLKEQEVKEVLKQEPTTEMLFLCSYEGCHNAFLEASIVMLW